MTGYSDDEIKGTILSRVVLLLFKHMFDLEPRQKLPEIFAFIGELLKQKSGLKYLEILLRYICSVAENITPEELLSIAQQTLDKQGGEVAMTIAEQLIQKGRQEGLEEGREEGLEKGTLIGEILFAQKIMNLTIYTRDELETKNPDALKDILTKKWKPN